MNIFFDFDGTLVDVKSKYYKIYVDFVGQYNGTFLTIDNFWDLKRTMASTADLCLKSNLDASLGDAFKLFTKDNIEKTAYLEEDTLFDNTIDVLKYFVDKRANVNIISMRRNALALNDQVKNLGLNAYVNNVYAPHAILGNSIVEGDPLAKSHAIKTLAFDYDDAVLIGDTGTDLSSGKELGWDTVAVLTGLRDKANVEKYQPTHIIENLNQLKKLY